MDKFGEDLTVSTNAFVSHYFMLKEAEEPVPDTLGDYLAQFAPSTRHRPSDSVRWTRKIMSELEPRFRDYGVDFEHVRDPGHHLRDDIAKTYSYHLTEMRRKKDPLLVDDDVWVLAHMRRRRAEEGAHMLALTWDVAMISTAAEIPEIGWVLSPDEANDLTQTSLPLSQASLCTLAHSLARAEDRPREIAARILDRVARIAADQLPDWQFREKIAAFKNEMIARIDTRRPRFLEQVDREVDKFLESEGVGTKPADRSFPKVSGLEGEQAGS